MVKCPLYIDYMAFVYRGQWCNCATNDCWAFAFALFFVGEFAIDSSNQAGKVFDGVRSSPRWAVMSTSNCGCYQSWRCFNMKLTCRSISLSDCVYDFMKQQLKLFELSRSFDLPYGCCLVQWLSTFSSIKKNYSVDQSPCALLMYRER